MQNAITLTLTLLFFFLRHFLPNVFTNVFVFVFITFLRRTKVTSQLEGRIISFYIFVGEDLSVNEVLLYSLFAYSCQNTH